MLFNDFTHFFTGQVSAVESYLNFLLFLFKLSFSDTTVYRRWLGKKILVRCYLDFGRHDIVNNTPVYVNESVYKSGYSRVLEPARALPRLPSNFPLSIEQSYIFKKFHPQKGFRHTIGVIHFMPLL